MLATCSCNGKSINYELRVVVFYVADLVARFL